MKTQDTFDFDDQPARSGWNEVPQPLFLSWSVGMQLAYCAARDYDSAEHEDDPKWCQFFIARAQEYERMLDGMR